MPSYCATTEDNSAPAEDMESALGFTQLDELKQCTCKNPSGSSVSETVPFSTFPIKKIHTLGENNTEISKRLRSSHVSPKVSGRFATDF